MNIHLSVSAFATVWEYAVGSVRDMASSTICLRVWPIVIVL